jgi:hypothetical protein
MKVVFQATGTGGVQLADALVQNSGTLKTSDLLHERDNRDSNAKLLRPTLIFHSDNDTDELFDSADC